MSFQRKLESSDHRFISETRSDSHSSAGWNPVATDMYYVYIMASRRNGTLYIGVTNNLIKRIYEHKNDLVEGFTKKYGVHMLVYYEQSEDVRSATEREKRLKALKRRWKLRLIEEMNPEWNDLFPLIKKYGYTLIHPSNDLKIIAGAGTAAYELIKEVEELDYVFSPVGGGGLLSGTAIATRGLLPSARVIGVEPENADDAYQSFKTGRIVQAKNPNTIADGLKTSLGNNTFRIIRRNVDQIITISEESIVDAMRLLWERMKLVVEPSGAVSLAGVLSGEVNLNSKRVGVLVSGGNIDLTDFFEKIREEINR